MAPQVCVSVLSTGGHQSLCLHACGQERLEVLGPSTCARNTVAFDVRLRECVGCVNGAPASKPHRGGVHHVHCVR
eukprot:6466689-Amphidinium_carterae.2